MSREIEEAFYRLEDEALSKPEGRILEWLRWPAAVGERDVLDLEDIILSVIKEGGKSFRNPNNECEEVALPALLPDRNGRMEVLVAVAQVAWGLWTNDRSLSSRTEAAVRALGLFVPWFILGNRLLERIGRPPSRDRMGAFENAADAFNGFLSEATAANRNRGFSDSRSNGRREYRDERREDRRGLGAVASNIRRNGGFGGGSSSDRTEGYNDRGSRETTHREQRIHHEQRTDTMSQTPAVTTAFLSARNFAATTKLPHPPFYYSGTLRPVITPAGEVEFMTFTPQTLALPPEDNNPTIARFDGGRSSGGINMPTPGALKRFEGVVTEQAPSNTLLTEYVKNIITAATAPAGTYVARLAFDLEVAPKPDPCFAAFIEELYAANLDVRGMAGLMSAAFNGTTSKSIAIGIDSYWLLNSVLTRAFSFISEVMFGIDPYAVGRIESFGPTGRPEDANDVSAFVDLITSKYGNTFYETLTTGMASLLRRVALPGDVNTNDSVKQYRDERGISDDVVLLPTFLRREVYLPATEVIQDLRAIMWGPNPDGSNSPAGFAPCVITEMTTPMLFDLATKVMSSHPRSTAAYAVLNFGCGTMTLTKSAVSGALLGKWRAFN